MNLVYTGAYVLALLVALFGISRVGTWIIERRNPPIGSFMDIGGADLHYVHVPGPKNAGLPPIVFVHGASGNLMDQMLPLRPKLEGRAELLFVDRPGHGWSDRVRGREHGQGAQAAAVSQLMERLGMSSAIIVGHSFGASVAVALALEHPAKTKGLLFLSAATHPWPGGATSWYYRLTTLPVIGWLFSETVAMPAGLGRLKGATACVFAPNSVPDDYLNRAAIPLVLRPRTFRANAFDVESLYRFAVLHAPRYGEIDVPTVIVTGDADTVVYEEIHSAGLARDIPGSEIVWVRNLGHKPDWIATDLVVAAIEKLAGIPRDLQEAARMVEQRISSEATVATECANEAAPSETTPSR